MNELENYVLPGLSLLPTKMDTLKARAHLLAIGFQESGFENRKQIGGPARGFWQFERGGGIHGVLTHPSTSAIITDVCKRLVVPADIDICYGLVAYHDALACCFARLLLWTLPRPLPGKDDVEEAWSQYIMAWGPGKPRKETWERCYRSAWTMVET